MPSLTSNIPLALLLFFSGTPGGLLALGFAFLVLLCELSALILCPLPHDERLRCCLGVPIVALVLPGGIYQRVILLARQVIPRLARRSPARHAWSPAPGHTIQVRPGTHRHDGDAVPAPPRRILAACSLYVRASRPSHPSHPSAAKSASERSSGIKWAVSSQKGALK